MTRWAVLLRGVNVGGVTVKMADLRELLTRLGYTDVATVLASGNALVSSDRSAATVKSEIEAALGARYGYPASVHVLSTDAVRAIVDAYPFEVGRDGWHDYVVFVNDESARAALLASDPDPAHEQVAPGEGVVYWTVPKGDTLDSTLGKALGTAAFRPHLTSRNLNTLRKLLA